MPRYPHFLEKAKGGRFPARIVCLFADSRINEDRSTGVYEREELTRWAAYGCELTNGVPGTQWYDSSTTEDQLWMGVQRALKRQGQTLVVSYCCSRVWGLVGLWERIESGEIDIVGVRDEVSKVPDDNVASPQLPDNMEEGRVNGEGGSKAKVPVVPTVLHAGKLPNRQDSRRHRHVSGFAVLEDPPTILSARMPGLPGTLVLCDLRNWGDLGYPVGKDCREQSSWCLDVMRELIELVRTRGWGSWCLTAGSQAMHTFRAAFLTRAVHCHNHYQALQLENAAYYGGRCEARRIGKVAGMAYHLDFRNLYPSVCINTMQPVRLIYYTVGEPAPIGWHCDWPDGLIACVSVRTDEPAYPVRRDGLTIYPVGEFTTTLAGRELADAEMKGRITAWHRYARYDVEPALEEYMEVLHDQLQLCRDRGLWSLCAYIKTLLVCLPGKFGQRGGRWEPYTGAMPPCPWSAWSEVDKLGEVHRCRSLGWQTQREVKEDWSIDAVPSIAAWVTSAGRQRLLQAIRCAGWHNVYYHDTDSLIVSEGGYYNLLTGRWIEPNRLGKLREIERGTDLEIMGVKHYRMCGLLRCSGLPKGTIEPSWDKTMYWYRAWLKDAIKSRRAPRSERYLKQYRRAGAYKHGVVLADGSVSPHVLQEG